jgi:Na+-driven multidrug efflux pump
VIQFQWGILGVSITTNIAYVFNMIIQDLWISLYAETEFKNMWLGWGRSTLEGLSTFMEYAVPSVFIECSHWWSLQLLVFVCGYDQLSGKMAQQSSSSQMAILSLFTFTFMFPLGLSYTISGMVGSFIGQRKYEEALRYAKVGYAYGMGLTLFDSHYY